MDPMDYYQSYQAIFLFLKVDFESHIAIQKIIQISLLIIKTMYNTRHLLKFNS